MSRIPISLVVLLLTMFVHTHDSRSQLPPGYQPYTPTRIEWLALELEATYRVDQFRIDGGGYSIDYVASSHDTITLFVRYLPSTDRELLNKAVNNGRELAKKAAKGHGWQGWVKIKEDEKMSRP